MLNKFRIYKPSLLKPSSACRRTLIIFITTLLIVSSAVSQDSWQIQVKASIDGWGLFWEEDNFSFIGMNNTSTDEYDPAVDIPDPPIRPPGNFIDLWFNHPEWEFPLTEFTRDIRENTDLSEIPAIWEGTLMSNLEGDTFIDFSFINLPEQYLVIYQSGADDPIIVEDNSQISLFISNAYEEYYFTITVGEEDALESILQNKEVQNEDK